MKSSHANSGAMFGSDLKILCTMDESSCTSFYKYIICLTCRVHLIQQGNNWFSDTRRVDDHDVVLRRQENRLAFPNGSQNIFPLLSMLPVDNLQCHPLGAVNIAILFPAIL